MSALVVAADQLPEDVGKAGPMGLLLLALLAIAIVLLVKSMSRHLKRVPASFDAADQSQVVVPDDLAELDDDPPGSQLLDQLRRAPRAIEPPPADRRPDDAPGS
jgi:hypothetical protein